jgi:hypothetical protein
MQTSRLQDYRVQESLYGQSKYSLLNTKEKGVVGNLQTKPYQTKPNHTQVMGAVPTISVEKTDGCQMYLSQESLNTQLITAQSSEMNVLLPSGKTNLLHLLILSQSGSRL